MIGHQQKTGKQAKADNAGKGDTVTSARKVRSADGSYMIVNPGLDKFSGDEFVPEKYKEDEARLANSILPHSLPSHK